MSIITRKQLKELFDCQENGILIRKVNSGNKKIGNAVGYLGSLYCFYHTTEEQFIGLKDNLYCLHDLDENTICGTDITKELRITIHGSIDASISDFVMVPMDNTFNVDFTRAIDANTRY